MSGFEKGSGCYVCKCCGKRTRAIGNKDNEFVRLCVKCYDEAGMENAHADGHHKNNPNYECPICKTEGKLNEISD